MVKQAYAQSIRDYKKSPKTLVLESVASSDVEAIGKAMKAAFAASTNVDDSLATLERFLSSAEMVSYYKEYKELERELKDGTAECKRVNRSLNREQRRDMSLICLSSAYKEMDQNLKQNKMPVKFLVVHPIAVDLCNKTGH